MTDDDIKVRVAMLEKLHGLAELRFNKLEERFDRLAADVHVMRQDLGDLKSVARMTRWLISVAISLGPALGVGLAKLLNVG